MIKGGHKKNAKNCLDSAFILGKEQQTCCILAEGIKERQESNTILHILAKLSHTNGPAYPVGENRKYQVWDWESTFLC